MSVGRSRAGTGSTNDAESRYRRRVIHARILVVLTIVVVPLALGARVHGIDDDAMAPVLRTGDAVVTWPLEPAAAEVGDLVTFRDPAEPGRVRTRRVAEVERLGPIISFETRGHDGARPERWHVDANGRIGAVSRSIPRVGHLLLAVTSPIGRASLFAMLLVPAIGLAVLAAPPRRSTGPLGATSTIPGAEPPS